MALLAALIFSPASLPASEVELKEAIRVRQDLGPQEALERFEKISVKDPQFKIVVEEVLKITYALQDWNRFFSYAQFYRKTYPLKGLSSVFLLEPLALMRHCQNETLNQFIETYQIQAGQILPEMTQMKALSQTRFKGKASKTQSNPQTRSRLAGSSLWRTEKSLVGQVHPRKLKIRVENQCKK